MIKITKRDEETTYIQKSVSYTFDVNGKKVRVYYWTKRDDEASDYDSDTTINEEDKKQLTDEEYEVLEEYMSEAMDLEVGKSDEYEI